MNYAGKAALALLALLACSGCEGRSPPASPAPAAQTGLLPVTIATSSGDRVYRVELAHTASQQERGLMYRTQLPPDGGMLFPFPKPQIATFWMKNTPIPLDMIFIRSNGTIAQISANVEPHSLTPVGSAELVAAVLEIPGGGAEKAGIAEGDRVTWAGQPEPDSAR